MSINKTDSADYLAKKRHFQKMLTLFGRKPVLEALQDKQLKPFRLHLAESNKHNTQLDQMIALAKERGVELLYHDKQALSRISKNAQQDQGVALDIECRGFMALDDFLVQAKPEFRLMALDNITNPQNLGMIIRSVCASPFTGLILPDKGCAKLDGLVIKASAGTLFKALIIRCSSLAQALNDLKRVNTEIYGLDAKAKHPIGQLPLSAKSVFVLGNETSGLSKEIQNLCTQFTKIPMQNGVESLNVSVAASLVAFQSVFK